MKGRGNKLIFGGIVEYSRVNLLMKMKEEPKAEFAISSKIFEIEGLNYDPRKLLLLP
jgi:hypothetical protein